jgi:hypothetical protein
LGVVRDTELLRDISISPIGVQMKLIPCEINSKYTSIFKQVVIDRLLDLECIEVVEFMCSIDKYHPCIFSEEDYGVNAVVFSECFDWEKSGIRNLCVAVNARQYEWFEDDECDEDD